MTDFRASHVIRHTDSGMKRHAGTRLKKMSSKNMVKSNSSRQPTTPGPNDSSLPQVIEKNMMKKLPLLTSSFEDISNS